MVHPMIRLLLKSPQVAFLDKNYFIFYSNGPQSKMEMPPSRYQLKSEFWMLFGLKFSGLGDGKFLRGQISQGAM
jgi:hypothetical protein